MSLLSQFYTWGTTAPERRLTYPCDVYSDHFDEAYYRGITIKTSPEAIFPWLCQMRVAPYSYDWIDNLGRQSPRHLTPGLTNLAIDQEVMTIFKLVAFKKDRHLTIRAKRGTHAGRLFGDVLVSYLILESGGSKSRLLVKLRVRYPRGPLGSIMHALLPPGDLIMMRRQLLNFKTLAEQGPGEP